MSPHHKGGAATMGTVTGQSVGIDISEDFLDVYLHPAGMELRLPHNDEGTQMDVPVLRLLPQKAHTNCHAAVGGTPTDENGCLHSGGRPGVRSPFHRKANPVTRDRLLIGPD